MKKSVTSQGSSSLQIFKYIQEKRKLGFTIDQSRLLYNASKLSRKLGTKNFYAIKDIVKKHSLENTLSLDKTKSDEENSISLYEQLKSPNYLKAIFKEKVKNKLSNKEKQELLVDQVGTEEILHHINNTVRALGLKKSKINRVKKAKSKHDMTLEILLSDIHFGKKSKTFNLEICRNRLRQITSTVLQEIEENSKFFNVEHIIIALMGDIIESFTMHGLESATSSEFGNSQQIQHSIEGLFLDVIKPLAHTGIKITIPCVTGNHDRTEKEKTMNFPGSNNVTWIIYNTLKMLSEASGLTNVTFIIPENSYLVVNIYKNNVLYEHGDMLKSTLNRAMIETFINKRSQQTKKLIDFFRFGHFHEPLQYGRGRIIANGSVTGQDSYAEMLGFTTEPVQIVNFYINTDSRPTCFYKSFPIYLN